MKKKNCLFVLILLNRYHYKQRSISTALKHILNKDKVTIISNYFCDRICIEAAMQLKVFVTILKNFSTPEKL